MSKEDAAAAQVHRFNATILASLAWSFCVMEDALIAYSSVHSGLKSSAAGSTTRKWCTRERRTITVMMNTTTPTFSVRGRGDNSTSYIRLPSPPCALALTRYPTSWAPPPDEAWNTQSRPPVVSWFQRDVGAILSYMGEKYEEEALVSGYRCDLLLKDAKPNGVVIEVDGPSHFAPKRQDVLVGTNSIKATSTRGRRLGRIPHSIFEWDFLEDAQQKSDYLRVGLDAINAARNHHLWNWTSISKGRAGKL